MGRKRKDSSTKSSCRGRRTVEIQTRSGRVSKRPKWNRGGKARGETSPKQKPASGKAVSFKLNSSKKGTQLKSQQPRKLDPRRKGLDFPSSAAGIATIPELERIKCAMVDLATGKFKNVAEAAAFWRVHAGRLYRRKSGECKQDRRGSPSALSAKDEEHLARWMLAMGRQGFEVTPGMVRDAVEAFCSTKSNPFVNGRPSGRWFQNFLQRNFKLKKLAQSKLCALCEATVTKAVITEWFHKLDNFLSDLNLLDEPSCIWNYGKTVVQLSRQKDVSAEMNLEVSVAVGVSAAGQVLPPFIVYKGLKHPPSNWDPLAGAPRGSRKHLLSKTRNSEAVLQDWLQNHLVPNVRENRPIVVLLSCEAKEVGYETFRIASQNDIYLFRILPKAKHIIQPLDIEEEGEPSFRTRWLRHLMEENDNIPITIETVAELIGNAWGEAEKPKTIKKCFAMSGVFPLDRDMVDDGHLPDGNLNHLQFQNPEYVPQVQSSQEFNQFTLPLEVEELNKEEQPAPTKVYTDSEISCLLFERLESKLDLETKAVYRTCHENNLALEGTPLYRLWKELYDEAYHTGTHASPERQSPQPDHSYIREEIVSTSSPSRSQMGQDSEPTIPVKLVCGERCCPLCDETYKDDGEEWVSCDGKCRRWFHVSCLPAELVTPLILEDKAMYCPQCYVPGEKQ